MLYKRNEAGNRLLADIAEEAADETIIQFLRMTEEDFEYMLQKITPKICKQDTYMKKAITVRERLIIGLRFIATGENFKSLQFLFRVSPSTIRKIVPKVCDALIEITVCVLLEEDRLLAVFKAFSINDCPGHVSPQ
uniref:Transposase Helix-turn-helix domain-containing protein n=1 Tax=Anopheles quadriannulatus TaxID=34691 RepID=A0A182XPF8_ANOQN